MGDTPLEVLNHKGKDVTLVICFVFSHGGEVPLCVYSLIYRSFNQFIVLANVVV